MTRTIFLITRESLFLYDESQKKFLSVDSFRASKPEEERIVFLSSVSLKTIVEPLPPLQRLDKPILFKRLRKKHFGESALFTCSLKKESSGFVFRGLSVYEPSAALELSSLPSRVFLLESLLPALLKKGDALFCVHFRNYLKEGFFIAFKGGFPFALQAGEAPDIEWDAFRRYLEKHHHVTLDHYSTLSFNPSVFEKMLELLPKQKILNLSHQKKTFFQNPPLLLLARFMKRSVLPLLILLNFWQGYTYFSLKNEASHMKQALEEVTQKIKPLSGEDKDPSSAALQSIASVWKEVRPDHSWKESFQKLEASLRPDWPLEEVIWENRTDISFAFKTKEVDEESPAKLKALLKKTFQTFRSSLELVEDEPSGLGKIIVRLTEIRDGS